MKDVFSAFGNEVFRPLVTLLLPGAIAFSTWFTCLLQRYAGFYGVVNGNRTESSLVLVLVMIFVGLVIEDVGSRWESRLDHKLNASTNGAFDATWLAYLRLAFQTEPTGRRYLRALVMRLKFELSAFIALLISAPGLWWMDIPISFDSSEKSVGEFGLRQLAK